MYGLIEAPLEWVLIKNIQGYFNGFRLIAIERNMVFDIVQLHTITKIVKII